MRTPVGGAVDFNEAYLKERDEEIRRFFKRGDTVEALSDLYDLSEEIILKIVHGSRVSNKLYSISSFTPKMQERLKNRIADLRLHGWNIRRIAMKLKVRDGDIKALIDEFKIPFGFRCEDCDVQVLLEKPSPARLCSKCKKARRYPPMLRYFKRRYHSDPEYRRKVLNLGHIWQQKARLRRKQAKILG